ncbi:MAG TPA: molybdopterin cofactor-binding domain-containing protein, partial [Actinomycetes bacterium]
MGESRWVGRPLRRREDAALLRGEAAYVDDLVLPGMAHMVAVRSPEAHARLGRIDAAAALRAPGVLAVLTAADLGQVGRMRAVAPEGAEVADVAVPLLADGTVRFAGEPVAAVVAETRAAALDAAELVAVDYDPLPVLVDPRAALASAARLHEQAPGNVLLRWSRRHGDVDGAFAAAAHRVGGRFGMPRLVAAPIEPRGAVAAYDPQDDLLTLWLSAQDPHRPLRGLAALLRRPPERCRVVVRDVGGAFGSKGALAPEAAVAAVAAMRLGRPVKWIEQRWENFQAAYQGRGQEIEAELALDAAGRFLALRARTVADLGAYLYPFTAAPPVTSAMLLTGAYDVPAVDVEVVGVATNKVP